MALFPAVPGIVKGVPEGKTGIPKWLEGSIMEAKDDCTTDGVTALVAGEMTPSLCCDREAFCDSEPSSPRGAAAFSFCRVSFPCDNKLEGICCACLDERSMLSNDDADETEAGQLPCFPSSLSDGVIACRVCVLLRARLVREKSTNDPRYGSVDQPDCCIRRFVQWLFVSHRCVLR